MAAQPRSHPHLCSRSVWFVTQEVKRSVDFRASVRAFFESNEYLMTPEARAYGLVNVATNVVNQGVFFRSAKNRREKTYWLPGLNAGTCTHAHTRTLTWSLAVFL